MDTAPHATLRRVVALNVVGFAAEFGVAYGIESVALFADSVDFLEDASLSLLVLVALGLGARARGYVGVGLAGLLLVPSGFALWAAATKLGAPAAPPALPLVAAGIGALLINAVCATMLARHRDAGGSLMRAAFLSARNDAIGNLAVIAAGLVTALLWRSGWPDILVGLGIAALNAGAAREVFLAARAEAGT